MSLTLGRERDRALRALGAHLVRARLSVLVLLVAGLWRVAHAQVALADSLDAAIARLLRAEKQPREIERVALRRLYPSLGATPLWTTDTGPTDQALAVLAALVAAEDKGLTPADYDVRALRRMLTASVHEWSYSDAERAADRAHFDLALSRALVHFLADLHMGRVNASRVRFDLPESHDDVDLGALALAVSRAPDVPAAIRAVEPPYAGYAALGRALGRYRALAADTSLHRPADVRRTVRPGDWYAELPTVRRLLVALGDLDSTEAMAPRSAELRHYDGRIVDAVMSFQRRHGLEPDGIIGPATIAQLRVPLSNRVRQIELTLERWRWLPDRAPPRYAVVNIPGFRLSVFENDSTAGEPALSMKVIVGQAQGRHGTPVFVAAMQEVVFNPYWDVPLRIARDELLPMIRRDPDYLERESFEIVRGGDDDAVVYPPTPAHFARVAAGTLRLRQRPAPTNSLGAIKFVFPNRYNVYLHGTPAIELFAASRRDFSHGCIRIEEPVRLAELLLKDQAPWNRAAVDTAIVAGTTQRVRLARPVAVFILYATAVAREDGTVYFHPDLYGHDAALARALTLRPIAAMLLS